MKGGGGRGDFGGVDVAFEERRGLFGVRAVLTVRDGGEPDGPALERRAGRLEGHEVRMGGGECLELSGELVEGVQVVESRC